MPTSKNPADDVTKGLTVDRFVRKAKWLSAPSYLLNCPIIESPQPVTCSVISDDLHVSNPINVLPVNFLDSVTNQPVDKLISNFSSLQRLKRSTAWLLRFGKCLKYKYRTLDLNRSSVLTVDEVNLAESLLIRAIHFEIVYSMTADSFLMAFDRFQSRRGQVDHLYSDNGTNFVSASKTFKDEMKQWSQRKAHESLKKVGVEWHFNAPYASHHGSCWERLIRSVKKVLSALSPRQSYTDESLQTLSTEVETIVNSRPLTPVQFSEVTDKPLTPNDLLLLKTPVGKPVKNDKNYIRNRRSQMSYLSNEFWQRWDKEYLPIIAPRTKWLEENEIFKSGMLYS